MLLNQVFDLKSSSSLSNTVIRLKEINPNLFTQCFSDTAAKAPKLFARAAMILDFDKISADIVHEELESMRTAIHGSGAVLLAVTNATKQQATVAQALGVPVVYDNKQPQIQKKAASPVLLQPRETMVVPKVRSGMQVYAKGKDLIVRGDVNYGSEVIADGSIYVYGALHGKALSGVSGDELSHTLCLTFNPELLSIAGIYVLHENIPSSTLGGSVRAHLANGKIQFMSLSSTTRVNI